MDQAHSQADGGSDGLLDPGAAGSFGQVWRTVWAIFRADWWRWIGLGVIALGPPLLINLLPGFLENLGQPPRPNLTMGFPQVAPSGPPADFQRHVLETCLALFPVPGAEQLHLAVLPTVHWVAMSILGWLYLLIVLHGAGSIMAARALAGQPVSLRQAVREVCSPRAGRLLAGNLLVGIILGCVVAFNSLLSMPFLVEVGIACVVFGLLAWLPLLNPLLVLEAGPVDRLVGRAWYFGRQRVWTIAAALACLWLLLYLGNLPLYGLQDHVLQSLRFEAPERYWPLQTGVVLVGVLIQAVVLPLGVIVFTVLYADVRARLDAGAADSSARPATGWPWLAPRDVLNALLLGLPITLVLSWLQRTFIASVF